MSITVELWEDSGAAAGSPAVGTTRQSVGGISWKASALDETYPYVDYPVQRPDIDSAPHHYVSYEKFNYFKMSGTYPLATRMRCTFIGAVDDSGVLGFTSTDDIRLYYRWASDYTTPVNTLMSGTYLVPGDYMVWTPFFSSSGPESATTRTNTLTANTTYYSAYMVTQLYVEPGVWTKYGNIGDIKIEFTVDEYETTGI